MENAYRLITHSLNIFNVNGFQVSDIINTGSRCIYPSTSANILGYIAAVLLLIAQITISVLTRCACCQRNTSSSKSIGAIITFVISWVASVIGIILLISAANLSTRHEHIDVTGLCYTVKAGIFSAGGCMAILAGILGLFAYYSSTKHNQQLPATMPYNQAGIAMGHPQFNDASSNPYPKQQQYA
ncbi:putative transport protein MmpL4 [Bienertia sinuspersici]